MKTIVTHMSPDLDAIGSSWLVKKYMPGWDEAPVTFVPAGKTLAGMKPDDDEDIIHVDTGLGRFDHHQLDDENQCATRRVFDYLAEKNFIPKHDLDSLSRIVNFATKIDHFQEVFYTDPTADVYDFSLNQLIEGLKGVIKNDAEVCRIGFQLLDAELTVFKRKIRAEEELKEGLIFQTKWGKALAIESKNDEIIKYAQKSGYVIVVRKDPKEGHIRIKSLPLKKIDLTPVYEQIKKIDKKASWFFHISRHMLLNGSSKNPDSVPSALTLKRVVEIIKKIA